MCTKTQSTIICKQTAVLRFSGRKNPWQSGEPSAPPSLCETAEPLELRMCLALLSKADEAKRLCAAFSLQGFANGRIPFGCVMQQFLGFGKAGVVMMIVIDIMWSNQMNVMWKLRMGFSLKGQSRLKHSVSDGFPLTAFRAAPRPPEPLL